MHDVTIDPRGGPLAVEIVVTRGQPGGYRLFLWDARRTKQRGVAAGITTDRTPGRCALPVTAARAVGRIVEWNVVVEGELGDPYDLTLKLLQDGRPLRAGRVRYRGELEARELAVIGMARFVARERA